MIPLPEQWQIFMALGGGGLLLAFLFDCYRVGRYFWRPRGMTSHLGDAVFWLILTVFTFALLMFINWGEMRAYVFLGLGMGVTSYSLFLSGSIRPWLYRSGRLLGKVMAGGQRLITGVFFIVIVPGRIVYRLTSLFHRHRPPHPLE
ncbi:MAG: spore cortex biosynthesis protein YabQ [Moorella humiferrea]|nr:spore cortex biosynthesis protein YabQ [Moorella humiferrea]